MTASFPYNRWFMANLFHFEGPSESAELDSPEWEEYRKNTTRVWCYHGGAMQYWNDFVDWKREQVVKAFPEHEARIKLDAWLSEHPEEKPLRFYQSRGGFWKYKLGQEDYLWFDPIYNRVRRN